MKPAREHATNNAQTYFVTAKTWESRALFRADPWARLFFHNLLSHRESYLLHEFVLMPDHFHLLITPHVALERSLQFIKGGFSFRAKKELGSNAEIWQRGFSDHRIRDAQDYDKHLHYIYLNPVKKSLCEAPSGYRYSSAYPAWKLDPIPQGLKPGVAVEVSSGTAEAGPFQNRKFVQPAPEVTRVQTHATAPKLVHREATMAAPEPPALNGNDFSRAERNVQHRRASAPVGGNR